MDDDLLGSLGDDLFRLVVEAINGGMLIKLKAVSHAWRTVVRRMLFSRLCHREGQPIPSQPAEVTDLDVEALNQTGRGWEGAAAGQMLPNLARLHGFGFVVDVAAVQAADLDAELPVSGGAAAAQLPEAFGGTALRGCITGSGEPPLDVLLAAVACAASGDYHGVPVQALREDEDIGDLNLSSRRLGPNEARLLALLLPRATSLHRLQ